MMLIFQVRLLIILTRINPKIILLPVVEQDIDISMNDFLYRKIRTSCFRAATDEKLVDISKKWDLSI